LGPGCVCQSRRQVVAWGWSGVEWNGIYCVVERERERERERDRERERERDAM
jgi:hypothetical protein